jgi:hypothetical protein
MEAKVLFWNKDPTRDLFRSSCTRALYFRCDACLNAVDKDESFEKVMGWDR